jgi:CheY-like chemotaxis protein
MKIDDISTWSVLIIDDEPDNIDVISVTLEFRSVTVKTAASGMEALTVLQDFHPTVILLDLTMPGIDGWQLQKTIRSDARTSHIPIIALTAHAMYGDKERVLAAGFDGYISKPVDVVTFVATLQEILTACVTPEQPGKNSTAQHDQLKSEAPGDRSKEHDVG